MLLTNNTTKTVNSNSFRKLFLLITLSAFSFIQATASELNSSQHTVSQGVLKKNINEEQRKIIIESNKLTETPDQLNGKATAKTRTAIMSDQSKSTLKSKNSRAVQKTSSDYYADFSIYSAVSFLHDDFDDDGFYQTFSVTFDADIYSYTDNPFGEVYALLIIKSTMCTKNI